MELASFNKLFGSVRAVIAGLLVAGQPYTPPGVPAEDAGLAGVWAPLMVPAPGGGKTEAIEAFAFVPDGDGWRVAVRQRYEDAPLRFTARLRRLSALRLLELVPEQDLGWEGKGRGSHLLIGYSRTNGELTLTELGRSGVTHRLYRQEL